MTAHELQNLSSAAADEANRITGITERAILRGLVAAAEVFDRGDVQQAGIVAKQVKAGRA